VICLKLSVSSSRGCGYTMPYIFQVVCLVVFNRPTSLRLTLRYIFALFLLVGVLFSPLANDRHYSNDADGNRLSDDLDDRLSLLEKGLTRATSQMEREGIRRDLKSSVEVELIFDSPVTKKQMMDFKALGGNITYSFHL